MNKHTPGPWRTGRCSEDGYRSIDADDWKQLALVVECYESDIADPEGIANARLIAAAPDLLRFAEDFLRAWEDGKSDRAHLKRKALEVIAKAKGEA